ncbi:1-(5-phosphoribosyl)-5-[(5-phosphoribosylamino)methylideneamino] imidazole-4-carboxamide isomerase [Roseovarius sp. SCSIO 43702]|uniref:1-(5-phosphoribosyl)-5-[(5- phosphoribosylamino)methylideneamino] imidazole-4-carboxamide isomerase n=1 Tax=Roseovarius sp. SCSIO 43702 TaxID=2823043 RepID=UPI001C73D73B|nr:1-(5-phosphoribosyl)-5-[(5-phosphoribosylamino)methylideneamino] imidazole-4-carboxamide isomerase [Roseovarius sp. SCSIO 43702]QYX56030.1 1-(5-phosphoribosyl)-5-[(5-phosphoribosylamino)methylideneamino] imidazole-4-carboxamide isomerase [Roseovarius sp. SCSIO 43702]
MIIYPTLELKQGKCVTLTRGRLEEAVLWHVDPVQTARSFVEAGAEWMHITDMDGLQGENGNNELIEEIIRTVGIPVQLGGGFRARDQVERWIDKGAGRIVVSTMAAHDPDLLRELAKYHPDQMVLAVDIFEGSVMTEGWRSKSAFDPAEFIKAFDTAPLAGIIVTDIDANIGDSDASLGLITRLAAETRHPVIARGTIRTVDDVARLRYVPNISGALIGRALMARDVDLAEALAIAQPSSEPTAEFT